jgi:hypothetical protein
MNTDDDIDAAIAGVAAVAEIARCRSG